MPSMAVVGHRGSPDQEEGVVENTLEAFRRARRLGADGVELDVRLTADGGLAVHHDPFVPGAGPVHALSADDLPEWVPTLESALDACSGLLVNIEVKNLPGEEGFDPGDRVARAVTDRVLAADRVSEVVVSSFWPKTLEVVRAACPGVATGLLVAGWFDPGACVPAALEHGCSALHLHASLVTDGLVTEAHRAGLSVAAWTVNDRTQLLALAAAGVDTVITDNVATAREVVEGS